MLVFYPNNILEYESIMENLAKEDIIITEAKNSYWNENGKMLLDPDGYRIVIADFKIN